MRVYLAILEDRHIDSVIEVFTKYTDAVSQVENWARRYQKEKGYTFQKEEVEGWLLHVKSGEDTPWMRIEKKELR